VPEIFQNFLDSLKQPVAVFLGLLCFMAFACNAALLFYLLMKKSAHGLARCPKCGRFIACPHCAEDDESDEEQATA
jgi:hypothetical protein